MTKKQKIKSMRMKSLRINARQTMRTFLGNMPDREHISVTNMEDIVQVLPASISMMIACIVACIAP